MNQLTAKELILARAILKTALNDKGLKIKNIDEYTARVLIRVVTKLSAQLLEALKRDEPEEIKEFVRRLKDEQDTI